jgi:hypothetical protein
LPCGSYFAVTVGIGVIEAIVTDRAEDVVPIEHKEIVPVLIRSNPYVVRVNVGERLGHHLAIPLSDLELVGESPTHYQSLIAIDAKKAPILR